MKLQMNHNEIIENLNKELQAAEDRKDTAVQNAHDRLPQERGEIYDKYQKACGKIGHIWGPLKTRSFGEFDRTVRECVICGKTK